jgi:hypothetical protein
MISDDYMITRALLSGTHKPKVLVLGLTLRDFCDSHVSCAAATDVFKYLRNFMSVDDIVDLCMPEFWQRLDYWQSKINWLWDKKMLLQMQASQFLHSHMPKLAGQNPSLLNKLGEEAPTGNIAGQLKTEIEKGMFIVHANDNFPYTDNSGEYKTRFRGAGLKNLTNQSQFLALLLELAQAHKIKVILVNMPLTKANMALMPPGLYDQYLLRSKALAEQYHAPFLDLNDGKTFDQGDFRDTAHMRASGGRKLVDSVVKRMASLQYLRLF